jgi:hypothetical protein
MIRTGIFWLLLCFPGGLCAQSVFCVPQQPSILFPQSAPPTFCESFFQFGSRERDRIFTDYANLYNRHNVKNFGVVLLGAGVLANTEMDGNFRNWYQDRVRSNSSDDHARGAKIFGEGQYFIPVMAVSAFTYRFLQEKPGMPESFGGKFADRTFRGYLVGAPTLLLLQPILGAGRPTMGPSYWRPFRNANAVSGHTFIGAVPFITAAQMTDKPCVKGLLYALSGFTAWSRVNDDAHYLSQAILGWYLAYLSVRAVSATDEKRLLPRGLTIFPVSEAGSSGIGLYYQF